MAITHGAAQQGLRDGARVDSFQTAGCLGPHWERREGWNEERRGGLREERRREIWSEERRRERLREEGEEKEKRRYEKE